MPADIRALTMRQGWSDWLRHHGLVPLDPDERERLLDAARSKKRESGSARSFEHAAVGYAEFERTVISALQKLDLVIFLAVVGDPSAPVVARVELERLPLLLREAANTESTLALVNSETSDSLILDAPDPDSGPGEILVSASGVFLRVIDELMVAKRGGVEFTGN